MLCTLVISASIVAYFLFSIYKTISDSDSAIPLSFITDAMRLVLDEQRAKHVLECEIAVGEALEGTPKRDYKKVHSSMEEAVKEMAAAAGEDAPLTCFIISMQAGMESSFEKWSTVEKLEKHLLKTWPKTKPFAAMIETSRDLLVQALEKQEKYDAALQIRKENVELAEKTDKDSDHNNLIRQLNWLASFYSNFQEYDKAFDASNRSLELVKKQPHEKNYNEKLQSYLWTQADFKRLGHSFRDARSLYVQAISIDNKDPRIYSERGYMSRNDLHDFAGAIADFSQAIELTKAALADKKPTTQVYQSDLCYYYVRRSVTYTETKEYEKAIEDGTAAVAIASKYDSLPLMRRGDAYSKSGNLEKALLDFSTALKICYDHDKVAIHFLKGKALQRAGQLKKALPDYDYCIENASREPRCYSSRAEVLSQLGQPEKALTDYNNAEKCLDNFTPKHTLDQTIKSIPEWKERMAVTIYTGRAKVYDELKQSKLASADRQKAKQYEQIIADTLQQSK